MHLDSCRRKHHSFIGVLETKEEQADKIMQLFFINTKQKVDTGTQIFSAKNNLKPIINTYLTSIVKIQGINHKAPSTTLSYQILFLQIRLKVETSKRRLQF